MKKLVTLDFKKDQGLILRWNYIDLSKRTRYFRHILVVLTSNTQLAADALDGYIKNIKLGDLYTAVYATNGRMRLREWREKTNRGQKAGRSYLREELGVSFSFEQASPIIQKQIQQFGEPTLLNFILQNQAEIPNLRLKIRQQLMQEKFRFACTIFSPASDNHVSISEGINQLCLQEPFVFQFFHHYLNQMALEYAHLTITCRNGELNSACQTEWHNTSFSKIERRYYGPSIRYLKDVLHFVNSKIIYQGSYDLDITLKFKCFDGATYNAEKSVAITFDHNEMYNRTVCTPRKARIFYSTEDIVLEENPYESETLIFFEMAVQKQQPVGYQLF